MMETELISIRELLRKSNESGEKLVKLLEKKAESDYRTYKLLRSMAITLHTDLPYFSKEDVKNIFGLEESSLYRWIRQGKLIPLTVGDSMHFGKEDVYALLEDARKKYLQSWNGAHPLHGATIVNMKHDKPRSSKHL